MAGVWYYTQNGSQMGPVTEEDLGRMAAAGDLKPTELVWTEGMANWTSVATVPGLAPTGGQLPAPAPVPASNVPRHVPRDDAREVYRLEPGAKRATDDYEAPEEDYDEPRTRRPRKKGMSVGLLIALIGGGLFVLFVLVVGGIVAIVLLTSNSYNAEGTYSWNLKTGEQTTFNIYLKGGQKVDMEVRSNGRSDVDLFVYDGERQIAKDDGPSSNCIVSFVPQTSKTYRVVVWNRRTVAVFGGAPVFNEPNSGTLHYKQSDSNRPIAGPGNNKAGNNKPGNNNLFGAMDLDTNGNLAPGQRLTYNVFLNANTTYTIDLHSNAFDSVLELQDQNGQQRAWNDDAQPGVSLDAQIVFTPAQAGNYRIIASDLGNNRGGPFHLTVRH